MADLNATYGHKFLRQNIDVVGSYALTLATSLYNMFQPKSVIDMGSGAGCIINGFATYGIECVAVDGSESCKLLLKPGVRFVQHDFRKPFIGLKKFDLVICFEVMEHIVSQCGHVLLDGLRTLTGSILAFTACPLQYTHHVNMRPRDYWIDRLKERGFDYKKDLTAVLQKGWQHAGVVPNYPDSLIICSRDFTKPRSEWENVNEVTPF